MVTMHPGSADARKEEPLCKGRVSVHDLIDVDGYLYQWMHDFPVPTVCEPCKALAIQWAEKRCQELEAAEGVCRDKAERLRDRDAVRYRNSVKEANLEADEMEDEAHEYR